MSGSYFSLLSKYNTLYSLFLKLQNNSATQTLQQVLTAGNSADNEIILTDGVMVTGLAQDKLSFYHNAVQELAYYGVNYFRIKDATFEVNITNTGWSYEKGTLFSYIDEGKIQFVDNLDSTEGHLTKSDLKIISGTDQLLLDTIDGFTFTKNYIDPINYTLSSSLSVSKLNLIDNNGYESYFKTHELKLDAGGSTLTATILGLIIDNGLSSSKMEANSFTFNNVKGLYSVGAELQLLCPDVLDISANGLAFNGVQGNFGDVIISGGAGQPAEFEPITNLICHGSILAPILTNTILFSTYNATFSYTPTVILTPVSADTTLYIANIVSVNNLQFVYQMSGLGCASLNFIAL